jgi:hypothetical protein
MASRQKTVLAIVLTALVTIAPSFFSYLQARQALREKYKQSRDEAVNGYETLATSVKSLQNAVLEQHDYAAKLEGQITLLTSILAQLSTATPGLRMSAGSSLPRLEKPPTRPNLPAPPNFDAAQMER